MKLSERLYDQVKDLWKEAARKPFVLAMAKGTLDQDRFRNYMLQDYLYLLDYIDILQAILRLARDPDLQAFLENVIEDTKKETYRVHVPNMRTIGISDQEIKETKMDPVIGEYLHYMCQQVHDQGLLAGLTALLQCSWVYAYIGQVMTKQYPEEISRSPYKSWFDAYACPEYVASNQKWIDYVDQEGFGLDQDELDKLCRIFEICAGYENRFWDSLYAYRS